jgi:UDP-N-acetylglucosamine 4,6-dehydratase/5-epimerase
VLPFFFRLLAEGSDHLPITDPRMTRFSITLDEGVDFVLSCLATMRGGEVLVPKIPSIRITDLARAVAPELPHKVVGIRPGEKLHEQLITEDDSRSTIELPDRYIIKPSFAFWGEDPAPYSDSAGVDEGFCYASDTNQHWIEGAKLSAMVDGYR